MDEFKARLAKLSPEKQKLLLKQLQNKNKDHFEEWILPRKRNNSANSCTLSYAQQRLFVLEQLMPGNLAYNAPLLFRLNGKLNLTALKISLNEMARRHEILRTTFHVQDETPIQTIAPSLNVDVPVVDFRHLPPVEQEAEIQRLFQQETASPFDLSQLPLWRTKLIEIKEEEYVLLLTIHHIIFDGWSVGVLIGELGSLYEAAIAQKLASVPELPIQYADYALWQKQKLQGEFLNSQLDYWKKQLAGISSLQLPTNLPFSSVETTERGAILALEFTETLSHALKQLSHREQTTLNMTTLAAFFALLGRYTQQDDVAVGSVIANRNHREVESLIGFFVNTLVLRSNLSDNPPFSELLKRVRKITLEAYEHREMPFDLLVEKLQPERDWARNPLVQVGFAFQNAPTPVSQIGPITVHSIEVELSHARFDLELHLWEGMKGLEGTLVYKTSLFDAATITRLAGHYQRLLEGIVSNPNTRIQDLPLLTDAEFAQILVEDNSIHTSEAVQCLHGLFEAQVESNPNTIAVIIKDKKLTYRQLNEKSNQIAHYLKKQGVMPETIVGLCMECSVEKIAAILGILKVGGAFVLLDPSYPQQQLALSVTDTQIAVLLTQQHLLKNLSQKQAQLFCLDSDWQIIEQYNKENLNCQITSSNLAYITHSSGHNLLVEHRNIISHLNWLQTTIALSESDVVLHKTTQAQDTAIWEIFLPLVRGSQLVIATSDHPTDWQKLIATHRVSILHLFPSELSLWLASIRPDVEINSLRWVLCSGEPLPCNLHQTFYQHFAACRLHYFYSQPEAGGAVTLTDGKTDSDENKLSVGYPIVGKTVYVLNRNLRLVPIGVKGEIYIGGNDLARGYLNDYPQTAQHFIPNPFSKKSGDRLFKTGDFGRRLNNGSLEVLGSLHRTAWIKGFKVNLAEIEAALLDAPIVNDCVVLIRETTSSQQLVAYVVTTLPFVPQRLQSHLQGRLPAHMRPDAYVPLARLPLTKAGEVDNQVLTREAVIDANLIQQWETQLRLLPEIEEVAVVVGEQTDSLPALHLSELIPSVHRTPAASSQLRLTTTAISHSQPLPKEAITSTLASALKQAATSDKGLIYVQPDGSELVQIYQNLLAEAERILAGLRKHGLQPQDKVIFQLDNSQDFITAFWACILGGFVPVPVSVAASHNKLNKNASKLLNIWQMLEQPPILTRNHFAAEIQSLSSLFDISPMPVVTIEELRQPEGDSHWHQSNNTDLAVLFLTSGSTGMPKAVMLTHRNLLSMSAGTIAMNGFCNQDTSLNWMPLDHVGAFVFLSLMPTNLGCWQIHVPTEVILQNPLKWLDLIHRHRASISWAPNFAFTLICDRAAEIRQGHWDLSSMRFLVNAGEPIVAKTARNFLKLLCPHGLPTNAIHPAFGMCETCSGITWAAGFSLESSSDDMSFVELGLPIPGASIRIVDENQQVVREGTIGHLQVKGDSVTSGYYQNPEANQKAFTEDGWFNTGDLAFLHQGHLTITGREKELIIINGQNYYSHELEAVVEEIEGVKVSYTAACAVRGSDSNTDQLAIFFSSVNTEGAFVLSQIKKIRAQMNLLTGLNPDYIIPVTPERIPKTSLGKIERSRLRKQFTEGEFNQQLKELDIEIENTNTLPNWFFRQIWRRKQVSEIQYLPIKNQQTLVFVDTCGLGQALCSKSQESLTVQVEAGADFVQLSPHRYRINPNNPEHYLQLLKSLVEAKVQIQRILHLWTYEESIAEISSVETLEQIQEQGLCSLLFLAQALVKVLGSEVSVQLYVISNHTQQVFEQEAIAAYKAPILGLLKTIPQEITGITCRHIDFSEHRIEENATYLLQEVGIHSNEPEVAFRNGQRWIHRLERVNLRQEAKQDLPFKPGGMYIISGGLGGIGVEIAKALIQRYSENPPRLLLLGRTSLPDETNWSTYLQQDTRLSQMIKAYQTLKQFGSNIIYEAIDVCDFAGVKQAVQQAESQWGCKLDGVIHLAGIPQEQMLVEETRSSLMAVLRPKMLGSWVLHRLIENQPDSLFITFSSVNSFFGGATIGAYAAANSFVESFTRQYSSHLHSYCLTWSMWDEIGMSAGYEMKDFSGMKGYFSIPLAAALHSFVIALHHNQKQLFIGLDGSNLSIRRYSETESHSLQRLKAYFTSSSKSAYRERLHQLMVCDRFGTPSRCDFLQVVTIPRTHTSEIDWQKLLTGNPHQVSHQEGGEIERQLAKIWQAVLSIPQVNLEDNFFELGGNSLRATQLIAKVRNAFGVDLSVRHLFESPTVLGLSRAIQNVRYLSTTTVNSPDSISKKTLPPYLITLQELGEQPPLFLIHPIAGVVFPYYELSSELAPDQPVYGLQSVGLAGEGQPLDRIEDMAACYIEAMQMVQPEGPYHLAGWSSGATIAWEMAVQLERRGQSVGLVALIDTPPPLDGANGVWQLSQFFLNTVAVHIWPYVYDYFYLLLRQQQSDFSQWLSLFNSTDMVQLLSKQSHLLKHEQPNVHELLHVMFANMLASTKYMPTVYPGRITLLRTNNSDFSTNSNDETWGWNKLSRGGVEVHQIPGHHLNIVKPPYVRALAQKLKLVMTKKTSVKL